MTEQEKQLLLQDLCARLPHSTKVQRINSFYRWRKEVDDLSNVFLSYDSLVQFKNHIEYLEIKPYLRPMSSITEEERIEMGTAIQKDRIEPYGEIKNFGEDNLLLCTIRQSTNLQDWLNEHHFDYRGLIEKGLALEAPNGMYKI